MKVVIKRLVINTLPPFVLKIYRKLRGNQLYIKGFKDWKSAKLQSTSYETDEVFNPTIESARKVRDGLAVYERDSVIFDEIQYDWPLLSSLLFIAGICKRLYIVDFGGSLGTTYRQNLAFLNTMNIDVKWTIIEQEKLVEIGKREFTTQALNFVHQLDDLHRNNFDTITFNCSLCYLENPYEILNNVISKKPRFILITRNPMIDSETDLVALQFVRSSIYKASYPIWNFSSEKFLNFFSEQYDLVVEWEDPMQDQGDAVAKGFLFSKKNI